MGSFKHRLGYVLILSLFLVGRIDSAPSYFPEGLFDSTPPAPIPDDSLKSAAIKLAVIQNVNEESLKGEPYLIQKVDKVNGIATYRNPNVDPEKQGNDVFFTSGNNTVKDDIIVLQGNEDFLVDTGSKGVFVVLKRDPTEPTKFRVFYAYIRRAGRDTPKESIVPINKFQSTIEFDTWDHRGGSRNSNRAFGWTNCERTISITCKRHSQTDALEIAEYDTTDIEGEKGSGNEGQVRPKQVIRKTTMHHFIRNEVNEYYDFFWDLDTPDDEAEAVGKIVAAYVYQEAAVARTIVVAAAVAPIIQEKNDEAVANGRTLQSSDVKAGIADSMQDGRLAAAVESAAKSVSLFKNLTGTGQEGKAKRSASYFDGETRGNSVGKRGAVLGGAVGGLVDGMTSGLGLGTVDELVGGLLAGGGGGLIGGLLGGGGGGDAESGGGGGLLEGLVGGLLGGGGGGGLLGSVLGGGGGGGLLGSVLGGGGGGGLLGGILGGGGLLGGLLGGGGGGGLLGGLLGGLAGGRSVAGVQSAAKDMDTDVFDRYGWFTQDISTADLNGAEALMDKIVFMGFGTCEWTNPEPVQFQESTTVEATTQFILRLTRTQCSEALQSAVKQIIESNWLSLEEDKSLVVTPDCPLILKAKLTREETSMLSRMVAFESVSSAYVALKGGKEANPQTPDGKPVGAKVYGLVQSLLRGLDKSKKKYPAHFILIARNMAFTMKSAFVKLLQDYYRFKACTTCTAAFDLMYNNVHYVGAALNFIYAGMGPIEHDGLSTNNALTQFFNNNKEPIQKRIEAYLTA